MEEKILLCILWKDRPKEFPSVMRQCPACHSAIAVDEKNAPICEANGTAYICLGCALEKKDSLHFGGGMIFGEEIANIGDGIDKLKNLGFIK